MRHHIYSTRNADIITSTRASTRCNTFITITSTRRDRTKSTPNTITTRNTTGNTTANTKRDSRTNRYAIIRKKSFNWWRSSVSKKIKEPKYDINPNELYYRISEEDRETYYEPEGTYGAPLLKRSERRMSAILRKQAARIRLSLNLNRDSST